jgi:hypothetical protein
MGKYFLGITLLELELRLRRGTRSATCLSPLVNPLMKRLERKAVAGLGMMSVDTAALRRGHHKCYQKANGSIKHISNIFYTSSTVYLMTY